VARLLTKAGLGGDDPIVDGDVLDLGAHGQYLSDPLTAPHGGDLGADGVRPLHHVDVRRIDGRCQEPHQHFLWPQFLRQRLRLHLEDLVGLAVCVVPQDLGLAGERREAAPAAPHDCYGDEGGGK